MLIPIPRDEFTCALLYLIYWQPEGIEFGCKIWKIACPVTSRNVLKTGLICIQDDLFSVMI